MNRFTLTDTTQRAFLLLIACCLLVFGAMTAAPASGAPKAADLVSDGQPIDLEDEKYRKLFQELRSDHNFTDTEIEAIFAGQTINKRVLELMDKQWEAKPYYKYAPLFITPQIIATGRQKLAEHRDVLDRIEEEIGVDREIVVAIWGIETRYGTNQGSFNVLQTLNTLFAAYPRRSTFFRNELVHFLLLCRETGVDPKDVKGSYAGAFGQTQFIPSSFRAYALSFDGDDKPDVWTSVPDILASIANYLKQYHWTLNGPIYWDLGHELKDQRLIAANLKGRKGRVPWRAVSQGQAPDIPTSPGNRDLSIVSLELPPGSNSPLRYVAGFPNFQAITEWNHSNRYAMTVAELAEALKNP
ncbi:MAG: lytic murein transglycosylase [Desulfobulbaceae bacterium]|jgi:membrane-bound lytic murein transglycosylase B|nr:lytic murein transglycosylase [Desulfobulbaceae bacterium]